MAASSVKARFGSRGFPGRALLISAISLAGQMASEAHAWPSSSATGSFHFICAYFLLFSSLFYLPAEAVTTFVLHVPF
jgi:hypothetical protein